jgi:hypothetical protein
MKPIRLARRLLIALIIGLSSPGLLPACVLCSSQGNPLTKEIGEAKLVIFGAITSAHPDPDGIKGTSEFKVDALIKGDKTLIKNGTVTLPRYVPPTPGVKYLLFLDLSNGQIDPYRNIVCSSDRIVKYLRNMPQLTGGGSPAERQARFLYTFDYLADSEPELAADAYKEWAAGSNQDVAAVAGKLDAIKIRRWLLDPKTPAHCLSLYSYLLGSCGTATDADLLKRLIRAPGQTKMAGALDGLLSGLSRISSEEGWTQAKSIITSKERTFSDRHAVLRFLRFVHDTGGEPAKKELLACSALMLNQADAQDLMVEQMRQWQWWDLTDSVLEIFKPDSAQITKRAVVRYALSCPQPKAKAMIERLQKEDPELVKDVAEGMVFEKK